MTERSTPAATFPANGVVEAPHLLDKYQLRLPSFEGPLDVLLRLIERNQLPIAEISLVAVTGQFLDHVASHHVGSAALADFATIGSRLVLLKSRSLLPRPPVGDDDERDDDLVMELIEYQAVKEAAARLATLDSAGAGAFAHRADSVIAPAAIAAPPLARHQPRSLVGALRRRLSATLPGPESIPVRPIVTLREMAERILDRVGNHRASCSPVAFSVVIGQQATRQEVLAGFQAVLALIRRRTLAAEQPALFGEIILRRTVFEQILVRGHDKGPGA